MTASVPLELINMLSWVFAYVYSTTKGGPNFASYVIELYIFDSAFTFPAPSFADAAAILLLPASTVLIAVQARRTSIEVNPEEARGQRGGHEPRRWRHRAGDDGRGRVPDHLP